jgi:endonuclease/exonuclease/phosphatase family metal-dependent hydrolase
MSKPNKIRLASWNVLHIIHELNYALDCSFVLDKWLGNESGRVNEITKKILKYMSVQNSIICLQECPGDLLTVLQSHSAHYNFTIHSYKYGRDPKIKNYKATNPYVDHTEHLITIVHNSIVVTSSNIIQFEDPGKASLVIQLENPGLNIANIHCPFGVARNIAFSTLIADLDPKGEYIIIGDLNSEQWELEKMLDKKKYKIVSVNGYTRIAKYIKKTKKGDEIALREASLDHVIVTMGVKCEGIFVAPSTSENLSDHLMIGCVVNLL